MKLKDYAVTVESNGDIFICGGSDAATEAALNDFIGRYLSEKHRFKTSDSFFKQYEYKYNGQYRSTAAILPNIRSYRMKGYLPRLRLC